MSTDVVTNVGSETSLTGYAITALITIALFIIAYILVCSECETNSACKNESEEHYVVYSERDKWYCKECAGRNRRRCGDCANCGYCYDYKGRGECVPGDENGPYFREDCIDYEYIMPAYYTDVYPRWSYFYDDFYDPLIRTYRRNYYYDDDYDNNGHYHYRDYNKDHKKDTSVTRTDTSIGTRPIYTGGTKLTGVTTKDKYGGSTGSSYKGTSSYSGLSGSSFGRSGFGGSRSGSSSGFGGGHSSGGRSSGGRSSGGGSSGGRSRK